MKFLLGFFSGALVGVVCFWAVAINVADVQAPERTAGVTYAPETWKVFENTVSPSLSYRIQYPRDFDLTEGDGAFAMSQLQKYPVKIALPRDAFTGEGTNFAEGIMTLDYAQNIGESDCFKTLPGSTTQTQAVKTINGTTYHLQTLGEAAAGNLYESTVYRAALANGCFEAVTTLHTANIGNFDPGAVTEFDKTKTEKIFSAVLETLTFLSH